MSERLVALPWYQSREKNLMSSSDIDSKNLKHFLIQSRAKFAEPANTSM